MNLTTMFNTLRELDVGAIEAEAEAHLRIIVAGRGQAAEELAALLRHNPNERLPPVGSDPLEVLGLPLRVPAPADLLVVLFDGSAPPRPADLDSLNRAPTMPTVVVALGGQGDPRALQLPGHMRVAIAADLSEAHHAVAAAIAEVLPAEQLVSAGRRLPGIRAAIATKITQSTAVTNGSYALASSLPEQIPLLGVPFAVADILVLTKNQALMVYRLALAHGAQADFTAHLREILPVVGGAYVWRELARTVIGLVPVWGVIPRTVIAYGGTYVTGMTARTWFANGAQLRGDDLQRLGDEARQRAQLWLAETSQGVQRNSVGLRGRVAAFFAGIRANLARLFRRSS